MLDYKIKRIWISTDFCRKTTSKDLAGLHQHRTEILFFSLNSAHSLLNLSPLKISISWVVDILFFTLWNCKGKNLFIIDIKSLRCHNSIKNELCSFSGLIRGQPGNQIFRGCMIDIWRTAKLLALDHKRFQTTGKSLGLLEASKHTARTCYCCLLWLNLSRTKM